MCPNGYGQGNITFTYSKHIIVGQNTVYLLPFLTVFYSIFL